MSVKKDSPEDLAERFGVVDRQYREIAKPIVDEREQVRKKLQALYASAPADKAFAIEAAHYTVTVGERAMERRISKMKALADRLGKVFYDFCRFPLKDFDDQIPLPERKKFVVEDQTGAREIKAVPRSVPLPKAA